MLVPLATLALVVQTPPAPAPPTVFVDARSTSGANDGSSWADAFRGPLALRDALASLAPGASAELWLADGVYLPGAAAAGRDAHFALRDGVAIYGGFAGGESALTERDPAAHPCILSGDLAGDDVEVTGAAFPQWRNTSDNAFHVVRGHGVGPTARLDGVRVRRGTADGGTSEDARGACVHLVDASPVIANCVVAHARAVGGGALYANGGAPLVLDTRFEGNVGGGLGGAALVEGDVLARFERCTWRDNDGSNGSGLCVGTIGSLSAPVLRAEVVDSRFEGNRGSIGAPAGIGIYVASSVVHVDRTSFVDNRSVGGGGGIFCWHSVGVLRACDFVGNQGQGDGGGAVYIHGADDTTLSPTRLIDCRFVGNDGVSLCTFGGALELVNGTLVANDLGGAIGWPIAFVQGPASLQLANCIVRDHAPSFSPGLTGQFASILGGTIAIDASCVEGWDGSLPGNGNFDADPDFVDPLGADGLRGTEDDDLSLLPASPCLDRSDHTWRGADLATGLAPRFVDRPHVVDQSPSCAPVADLGAFELGPAGPWSDLGAGLGGSGCVPHLAADGPLTAGAPTHLHLVGAAPSSVAIFALGLAPVFLPAFGGTLVPEPTFLYVRPTDALGTAVHGFLWPSGLAAGTALYAQAWILDAAAPQGLSASNAQLGLAP